MLQRLAAMGFPYFVARLSSFHPAVQGLVVMGINLDDVPKGILAITKPVVLGSRVNSPDLRPLTAARRRDALRELLDLGVGDANVKEPTLPVLQGGLPLLVRRI